MKSLAIAPIGGPLFVAGALALVNVALFAPVTIQAQQDRWRLDISEAVTYFIAEGSAESGYEDEDRTLAEWALEAWGRQLDPPLRLEAGSESAATLRIYWVPAGAGLYGEMRRRRVEGRPAADVFIRPNTDALGRDIAEQADLDPLFRDTIVYLTCVHELGHAFGLPHTSSFADIMYSFQYGGDFVAYFMRFREQLGEWGDIREASPFSPADRSAFRSLYP